MEVHYSVSVGTRQMKTTKLGIKKIT